MATGTSKGQRSYTYIFHIYKLRFPIKHKLCTLQTGGFAWQGECGACVLAAFRYQESRYQIDWNTKIAWNYKNSSFISLIKQIVLQMLLPFPMPVLNDVSRSVNDDGAFKHSLFITQIPTIWGIILLAFSMNLLIVLHKKSCDETPI